MKKVLFCIMLVTCILGCDIKTDAREISEEESVAIEEWIQNISTPWSEQSHYLYHRPDKTTPERNNIEKDGVLLYTSSLNQAFLCAKNIEDVINNYISDYMYYDEESGNFYYEAGKQRKIIWGQYTGHEDNDYSDKLLYYDHGQTKSLTIDVKNKFNYCNLEQILGEVEIYDTYIFVNWGGDTYSREVYYKTSKGDFVYSQIDTPHGWTGEADEYLMPADEYIYYCHRKLEKMIEELRKNGFEDGGQSDDGNDDALSVFKIGSESFNINASLKPEYTLVYVIAGMIILTICIVIVILKKLCLKKINNNQI